MEKRALIKITVAASLVAAAAGFGCSAAEEDDADGAGNEVVAGGGAAGLKSTIFLKSGCTAVKVGPKHILLAARCVQGNADLAPGKILEFTSAAAGANTIAQSSSDAGHADSGNDSGGPRDGGASSDAGRTDSGSGSSDAGRTDAGRNDAGTSSSSSNASSREVKIAEVLVHESFAAKCKDDACAFGKLEASDAPDIALITLQDELDSVPTVPVDLDTVGQADPLLVVNGGCAELDARASTAVASKTMAVPAKVVNHEGSAYKASPQLVTRLASSYVVTPGVGWKATEPKLCKSDIGAPVFRANANAVAGITSNFTTYGTKVVPVTTHHTRLDSASRFKIGAWLSAKGVETIHSCSETAGGCVKHDYDGGVPLGAGGGGTTEPGDGGTKSDAIAPTSDAGPSDDDAGGDAGVKSPDEQPSGPHSDQLPTEDGEGAGSDGKGSGDEADFSDAAVPKKKKKAADSGCNAAPGAPVETGSLALGALVALGMVVARRRRRVG